tara:strand:- start:8 stop:355 length:348 start_codon:yes stop_codon:yes gene_type:complete
MSFFISDSLKDRGVNPESLLKDDIQKNLNAKESNCYVSLNNINYKIVKFKKKKNKIILSIEIKYNNISDLFDKNNKIFICLSKEYTVSDFNVKNFNKVSDSNYLLTLEFNNIFII